MCLQYILTLFGSHPLLLVPKHVMQGAHNVVIRDATFYVAQNVCFFHHSSNGLNYGADFLSRLKFMNMPAGVKMIHSLF